MTEYRCPACGCVLFAYSAPLKLRIRCRRCNAWNDCEVGADGVMQGRIAGGTNQRIAQKSRETLRRTTGNRDERGPYG